MPINSGILSFGLVAIPVKLYPAIKDQSVRFHLLHNKCGSRVRNQFWCPVCNEAVERDGLVRGFEYTKGKYIQLTEEELDALEAEANRSIDLKEFVPVGKIDPIYFESVYYLGPDEGGEKPYRLLAIALAKSQRAAVAELVSRGKEQIVMSSGSPRFYCGTCALPAPKLHRKHEELAEWFGLELARIAVDEMFD